MTSSRVKVVVAFAAVALLSAACGARIDPKLRAQAASAQLAQGAVTGTGTTTTGTGTGTTGTGTGTGTGTTGTGTGTGTTGTGTGTGTTGTGTGTGSGTGTGPGTGTGTGTGSGGGAFTGDNGGATDIGVTANSITVGNVADQSGPVPGLFSSAAYGAQAYFAYVNSQGGIFGRQFKLTAGDSQTDCTQTQNAYRNLIPKVFAFVGSFGLYDDCGAKTLADNKAVSDLSYALSKPHRTLDTNFSPAPAPIGYPDGMFRFWAKRFPAQVLKVGTLYPNVPSAALSHRYFKATAESVGWKYLYEAAHGATQTTFQSELQQMKNKGVQLLFVGAENAGNTAEIKKEADAQNFKPIFISPVAYAQDFIQRLGSASAAEGILGSNLYAMFFSPDDAANIPEVALFQQWMKNTHPSDPLELYSMYSWAAARMFVDAVKAVGPKLTRAALYAELKKVHNFNSNGFVVPTDPGAKKPGHCYVLWKIHNGKYERDETPAKDYRCDGTYFNYTGN